MTNTKIGLVIASRELTDARNSKRRIMVSLGMPRRVGSDEWQCRVSIDGLKAKPIVEKVTGVDSLQALQLGLVVLRKSLRRSPFRLAWLGESNLYPAGGIPCQVPGDLGEEFDQLIEQLIERETQRYQKSHAKILRSYYLDALEGRKTSMERASSRHRSE
jgi:hypothetical protein